MSIREHDEAECTVCWSDTTRVCACGDPICQNCSCPNGCEREGYMIDVRRGIERQPAARIVAEMGMR